MSATNSVRPLANHSIAAVCCVLAGFGATVGCGGDSSNVPLGSVGGTAQGGTDSVSGGTAGAAGVTGGTAGGAGALDCPEPTADRCADPWHPLYGRQLDTAANCLKPPSVVSCSMGGVALAACWVDATSGDLYSVDYLGCKSNLKWRDCTEAERQKLTAVTADCK